MTIDRAVFGFAGTVTLTSVALAHFLSPWFLWLTAFAGTSLIVASLTGVCAAAAMFRRLGLKA